MHHQAIGLFDPATIIQDSGPWSLILVCTIIFVETGLLIGFVLPGDTLLLTLGILTNTHEQSHHVPYPVWVAMLAVALAAFAGDQLGYYIGYRAGPPIFQRKEVGLISMKTVHRTEHFFTRFGPLTMSIARFIPVVRTVAPVAAGVGRMPYRRFVLFDALGAVLWGAGVVFAGWVLAFIPGLSQFVVKYIDIVLIAVVAISLIGFGIHWLRSRGEKKRTDEAA